MMNDKVPALECAGRVLNLSQPQVMGVLNVTPDSFSDGGHFSGLDEALFRAEEMIAQGAAIIDVGGESTRPGAEELLAEEEMNRVLPVIEAVCGRFDVIVSVDTSSPEVMLNAAGLGAGLINDVRALSRPNALSAAATTLLPVCLMHMQGQPKTMQQQPEYNDVVVDVCQYLLERVEACTREGISRDRLLLDPGFGFGKTQQQNFQLLKRLHELRAAGLPLLVGMSRKSMIGGVLNVPVGKRLAGSLSCALLAVMQGASIVRVHDVLETVQALKIYRAMQNANVQSVQINKKEG